MYKTISFFPFTPPKMSEKGQHVQMNVHLPVPSIFRGFHSLENLRRVCLGAFASIFFVVKKQPQELVGCSWLHPLGALGLWGWDFCIFSVKKSYPKNNRSFSNQKQGSLGCWSVYLEVYTARK